MKRLLQIEFIKLWNHRANRILILAYFILLLCIAFISIIKFSLGPIQFKLADHGIFNFPYIWHLNTYIAAILKLFFAIVIVSMVSNEYSNKTIKQNLIDGLSKKEFILSKFYTLLFFSVLSTIFIFVLSLILGLIYSDFKEIDIIFTDLQYVLGYFIKLVGFFSLCMFLGILIKKSAFSLGFLFLWQLFEAILFGLLSWKVSVTFAEKVANVLPLNAMANLIKEPFTRLNPVKTVANQIGEELKRDYSVHWHEILIVLGWTALLVYLSYFLLKKRDL